MEDTNESATQKGPGQRRMPPGLPGNHPKRALFFEIDFEQKDNTLDFKISQYGYQEGKLSLDEFRSLMRLWVPQKKFPNMQSQGNLDNTPNDVRERTKLSLKLTEAAYIVIKLSDNWRWCFNRDKDVMPFSIGELPGTSDMDSIFKNAMRLDDAGIEATNSNGTDPECRWAYFICDGQAAKGFNPNERHYSYRYNIHVQFPDSTSTGPIPIVIDPDVRWPGGDGP